MTCLRCADPAAATLRYHEGVCFGCGRRMRLGEPVATINVYGVPARLHAACGRQRASELRDTIIANVAENRRLRAEIDSLRIVPAADEVKRCVECGGSALPADPNAATCPWCGGVFGATVADDQGVASRPHRLIAATRQDAERENAS